MVSFFQSLKRPSRKQIWNCKKVIHTIDWIENVCFCATSSSSVKIANRRFGLLKLPTSNGVFCRLKRGNEFLNETGFQWFTKAAKTTRYSTVNQKLVWINL